MRVLPNVTHTHAYHAQKWLLKAQLLTQTHFHVPAPQIKPAESDFLVSPLVEQVGDWETSHTHIQARSNTHLFLMIDTIKAATG